MSPAKPGRESGGRKRRRPSRATPAPAPQRSRADIEAAAAKEQRRRDRNFARRVRREMQRSGKNTTNAKRAVRTRDAWRQARAYAKRHGTVPTLARRVVPVELTNRDIVRAWDELAKRRTRKRGGKRGTESRQATDYRVVIRRADGQPLIDKAGRAVRELRSDVLSLPANVSGRDIRKAVRNTIFATIGADLDYDAGLGELSVGDDGGVTLGDDELIIELENADIDIDPASDEERAGADHFNFTLGFGSDDDE